MAQGSKRETFLKNTLAAARPFKVRATEGGKISAEFKGVTLWTARRLLSLTSPITIKESGFP